MELSVLINDGFLINLVVEIYLYIYFCTGKFPCSVCLKGVCRNSILCPACKCWIHAKCSGLKGQLAKATNFVCSQCSSGAVADRNNEEKVMLAGSNLEVADKFCYLRDMLDAGGGAESSTVTRVRSGWKKFRTPTTL